MRRLPGRQLATRQDAKVDIRFIAQPFDNESNLGDFIDAACGGGFDKLQIAVAWAKRSGLGRVRDQLAAFRQAGGEVEMIVGVSEGGATREGLELALELSDRAHVFHDPRRTFHPKVYLATGPDRQSLLVGSSNLTAGGLGWNFETSLWVEWEGEEWSESVSGAALWMDALRSQVNSCQPLTEALIDQMALSRDIKIGSEAVARRVQRKGSDAPEDSDSSSAGSLQGLFAAITQGLRTLRPLQVAASPAPLNAPAIQPSAPGSSQPTGAPLPASRVIRRWFKQMDHTAAQKPKGPTSNATGNLRLSQAEIPIDHKRYFFETFFAGLPWAPTPGKGTELEVWVTFECYLGDANYGYQELRISHDPHRVSGQANVPTVLHWGSVLSRGLREDNFIGEFVTLERTESDEFRLIVAPAASDSYLV